MRLPIPIKALLSRRGHLVALGLLVAFALFLRLYGIDWDHGGLYHPDERAILMHVAALQFPTDDPGSLLKPSSPLNPGWFPYGSLPLYLLRFVGYVTQPGAHSLDLHTLAITGRAISAIFDVITLLVAYLIASRLFGKRAGLLTAAFLTFSVLNIQQSHFFVTDIMEATLIAVTFYFLVKVMEKGAVSSFALAGLFFGLALATKVSAAPFALAFVTAAGFYAHREKNERSVRVQRAVAGLLLAAGIAVLAFVIAQPYGIIDWRHFLGDIGEQSRMVRRAVDYPYTRQYIDTTPFLYQIRQLATWGLGWPLGIVVWCGLAFSAFQGVVRRDKKHLLILSWVLPYFLLTGAFNVKFMRYMLPIIPFFAIVGSQMLFSACDWLKAHRSMFLSPRLVWVAMGLVVAASAFYAAAYANIYSRPQSADRAAVWVNANVPPGSVLLNEHWEEELRGLGNYKHGVLNLYDGDSLQKKVQMVNSLVQGDYVILYSNRLYGTIPRLPGRYPLTTKYYELLFSGKLGYQLVHWETTYPNLLGVSFADDTFSRPGLPTPAPLQGYKQTPVALDLGFADESFTVYDHPKVLIFKKTTSLSPPQYFGYLDQVLVPDNGVIGQTPTLGLMLTDSEAKQQQAGGTWSAIFSPDGWTNKFAPVVWLGLIELVALLSLPLALVIFRRLPDRGYVFSKGLGILLVAFIPWLLASLHWMPFSRGSIAVGLVVIAMMSAFFWWRNREEIMAFLRSKERLIALEEAIFVISFLAFVWVRMWNPDLWHPFRGGEKPMDFAYLNAIIKSTYMPPYDPWFAGGYINYYYFGHFIVATLTKFTGIVPEVAFNLALPMFFALTAAAAFSLVYNLAEVTKQSEEKKQPSLVSRLPSPVWAGIAAVAFVVVVGNFDGIVQVVQGGWRVLAHGQPFGSFDFWRSSRMMPPDPPGFEITEFPFFTFLFADLHAHLMVVPFTLLALGLALALALSIRRKRDLVGPTDPLIFATLGLVLGAMRVINTWDIPTYLLLSGAAIFIVEYAARRRTDFVLLLSVIVKTGLLYGLTTLFFLPFYQHYQSFFNSVSWSETTTALWQYMAIHGLFIFIIATFVAWQIWSAARMAKLSPGPTMLGFQLEAGLEAATRYLGWRRLLQAIAVLLCVVVLARVGYTTVAFLTLAIGLMLPFLVRELRSTDEAMPARVFPFSMAIMALALGIGVDLFTLAGDINRMNTVFKFYLQAWVLLGLVSAYVLWRMAFGGVLRSLAARIPWRVLLVLLVASVLAYPVMGTPARARDRFNPLPLTLDGTAYMDTAVYNDQGKPLELKWDKQGILWLEDNVKGSPVIVEGLTPLYRWGGRVSVYTGLPAVVGWDWHEKQQRWGYQIGVDVRRADVDRLYTTTQTDEAASLLKKYGVAYIYVGQLEHSYYPAAGLEKFDRMVGKGLALAYENPQVRIYKVVSLSGS